MVLIHGGRQFLSAWAFLWDGFRFLIAQWLGSKSEHLKKLKIETTSVLRPAPRNWYGATSATFFWSSGYKGIQGGKHGPYLLMGKAPKNFDTMF